LVWFKYHLIVVSKKKLICVFYRHYISLYIMSIYNEMEMNELLDRVETITGGGNNTNSLNEYLSVFTPKIVELMSLVVNNHQKMDRFSLMYALNKIKDEIEDMDYNVHEDETYVNMNEIREIRNIMCEDYNKKVDPSIAWAKIKELNLITTVDHISALVDALKYESIKLYYYYKDHLNL